MSVSTTKIRVLADRVGLRAALGTVLTAAFYLPAALAEDAIPQSVAPGAQLEEVLVTAERRESKLQDTPIAVSVIDGGEIQRENLVNLSEIAAKAPSITFNQVNHSESFISIRGTTIGNDAAGIDQGVSVFIDEVPTTGSFRPDVRYHLPRR
jgi:iron complex outermembrane receptor protein